MRFKVFLKANVKPNKPFIFEHEIPFVFPGSKKTHTRQERCSWRGIINLLSASSDVQSSEFYIRVCIRRYEILYNKRNTIQGIPSMLVIGVIFQRFFPNLRKVVEIATWLILPVAYACLKD